MARQKKNINAFSVFLVFASSMRLWCVCVQRMALVAAAFVSHLYTFVLRLIFYLVSANIMYILHWESANLVFRMFSVHGLWCRYYVVPQNRDAMIFFADWQCRSESLRSIRFQFVSIRFLASSMCVCVCTRMRDKIQNSTILFTCLVAYNALRNKRCEILAPTFWFERTEIISQMQLKIPNGKNWNKKKNTQS